MRRDPSAFELIITAASALLVLFVLTPLVSALLSTRPATLWETLLDAEVYQAILRTFLAALLAVGFGLATGVPLAYTLARRAFPGRDLVQALINLPIIIPHTAAGVALLLAFGRRGLLGQRLAPLGLTFVDNLAGVVLAMTFVSLPFLVNASREAFAQVDEDYELAARVDGATDWQAFFWVTLPMAWRGVLSGVVMMWARGVSEFGAVVILAYHPKIVPVLVYERFEGFGLNAAQPVAVLLLLISLVLFGLLNWILPHRRSR